MWSQINVKIGYGNGFPNVMPIDCQGNHAEGPVLLPQRVVAIAWLVFADIWLGDYVKPYSFWCKVYRVDINITTLI